MSSVINGFIIFSLIITLAYFIGLITFINDKSKNDCEMTYMFEYPQYVKISQEIDDKYPKYGLYVYSEGRMTEASRNMYFTGIPVMFIPGNGGSHRQGRSFASIAIRKALKSHTSFHFDYFMIDLNSELSGLNGALLQEQLEYVNNSLYRILDLYKDRKSQPKSVILLGHSVGGIIARHLVSSQGDKNLVPLVITLASPHKRPPLMLDKYSYHFYKKINPNVTTNTIFVSVTGGYKDFLVPSYLTSMERNDNNSLSVTTSHIPRAWVEADHVCIMWCKQPILALTRALFDAIDPKTKQISTNPQFVKSMFYHHLVHHNGLNAHLRDDYKNVKANIRNQGKWIEPLARQYTVRIPQYSDPHFYMIRLLDQPNHKFLTVEVINSETVEWAFVCGAHIPRDNGRVCEEFTHLSHLSEISPSHLHKRRTLRVNMHDLLKKNPDWSHVVIRVLPSDEEVILNVDVFNPDDRTVTVNLPNLISFKRHSLVNETIEKALHYDFIIPQLNHVMQSYQLYIDSIQCTYEFRQATASLVVPWNYQSQHKYFLNNDSNPLNVRLLESRPQWASDQSATVRLALDPNCRYKVGIRSWIPGVLGQMARFYSPLLIVNIACVILMTLNSQLKSISEERQCSLFFVALSEGAKPYYILTSVKLLSRFLSIKPFPSYFASPDWLLLSQDGTDFFLLPLLLYVCSVGIVWLLGIILAVSLVLCETTVHKCALKFLAKTVSFTVSLSDYVMAALHKVPLVVAAVLISLSLTTTGSLALCVGMVFYFLRLTQLSQDYIEDLVWYYVRKIGEKFKRRYTNQEKKNNGNNNNDSDSEASKHDVIYFHATIFMLWCVVTVINVPYVLTWAHNFKYSTSLQPDPAFFPGLVLSMCAVPLWQMELPKIERKGYTQIGQFISVLAVASLIYAPISIYRLNYTVSAAIVVVTVHQLVAPNRDLSQPIQRQEKVTYEMIKAKFGKVE